MEADLSRSRRYLERTRKGLLLVMVAALVAFFPFVGGFSAPIFLAGLMYFVLGRKGFGPRHARWVLYGFLTVPAVVIAVLLVLLLPFLSLSFKLPLAIVVLAILAEVPLVLGLYNLMGRAGRRLLALAWGLTAALFAAEMLQFLAAAREFVSGAGSSRIATFEGQLQTVVQQFSTYVLFSSILWLVVYYIAYRRVSSGDAALDARLASTRGRVPNAANPSQVPRTASATAGNGPMASLAGPASGLACGRCHAPLPVGSAACPVCGSSVW